MIPAEGVKYGCGLDDWSQFAAEQLFEVFHAYVLFA